MSKILAYYPLHYGMEYLKESIQSIEASVDRIIILYTSMPSFGFRANVACPEKEEQLRDLALSCSDKVTWISNDYGNEGDHRKYIFRFAHNYDLILACDADEVWEPEVLKETIAEALNREEKYLGIDGFINFWRSFNHVCLDGFRPIRLINPKAQNELQGVIKGKIYHFSCAQSETIMDYKYLIHGHKDEIRKDWLEKTYKQWKQGEGDLHPVAIGLWNTIQFDKNTLPDVLKNHNNFNKDSI
jgi:hypothetical protein